MWSLRTKLGIVPGFKGNYLQLMLMWTLVALFNPETSIFTQKRLGTIKYVSTLWECSRQLLKFKGKTWHCTKIQGQHLAALRAPLGSLWGSKEHLQGQQFADPVCGVLSLCTMLQAKSGLQMLFLHLVKALPSSDNCSVHLQNVGRRCMT